MKLVLSDVEHATLLRWTRRAKTSQALALRSRIVLACAEGLNNKDVAARLGIWPHVSKWRAGSSSTVCQNRDHAEVEAGDYGDVKPHRGLA